MCRHAVTFFCAKHTEQIIVVGVLLNLLGQETCQVFFEMLRVLFLKCPGTPFGVVAHVIAVCFVSLSEACLISSKISKSVLFGSGTRD